MGWTFSESWTRKSLIADRCRTWENGATKCVTLRKVLVGNTLYKLQETTRDGIAERWIGVDMLQGGRADGWGYKDIEEGMGPTVATCPPSLFADVPLPAGCKDERGHCALSPYGDDGCKCTACHGCSRDWARKWRERCAVNADKRRALSRVKPGDVVVLRAGCKPERLTVISARPLVAEFGYVRYRVAMKHVDHVETVAGGAL